MLYLRLVGRILESLLGLWRQLSPLARGHAVELPVVLFDASKEGFPLGQPVGLKQEKTIERAWDMVRAASLAASSQRNRCITLVRGR